MYAFFIVCQLYIIIFIFIKLRTYLKQNSCTERTFKKLLYEQ